MIDLEELADKYAAGWRKLWRAVTGSLGIFGIFYGAAYAFQGGEYVTSPSLYVLSHDVPGHMHGYGYIAMFIGFAMMITAIVVPVDWHALAVKAFLAFSVIVPLTIFGSWWITGKIDLRQPPFFLAAALVAFALVRLPPPPRVLLRKD